MKTKRIWMWSFVFGIIAALVAYVVVFPAPAPVPASTTTAVKDDGKKPEQEPELPGREMNNKMIPAAEGMRAVSLKVTGLEQGVSGYIEPNSHIDIIAYESTRDEKSKKEMRTAKLVLQNIKVLASGKSADGTDEALRYETVTVEVTPAQGVELSLASRDKDGFYFMLRGKDDAHIEKGPISFSREVFKEGESEE
ncbi:Flp pilus assembly protein CpaB [Bacillus sp. AFS015802]|uniref:Flp pilus assembly protein CpaB n=1 Tax=Bacillus sp. AFS015802 TaxID=2033486 RepID=UPI000BF6F9D7|nr:Flp pilus assembly protein CpaB [Bacillus sp. AFS015802]PFA67272.1 Flp pilus assembly protein CpaB [Bacillus sp. AFS015802]